MARTSGSPRSNAGTIRRTSSETPRTSRRPTSPPAPRPRRRAMPQARSWQEMYAQVQAQLERQTGEDLPAWNAKIRADAPQDEPGLRSWLSERGVSGYPAMLLVYETFGYPDYL